MAKSETSKNIDIEALLGKTSERTSKEVNIEPKEEFKKEKAPVVEEKAPVVEETASEKNARIADEALKNASGYIRREISQRVNLRNTPQILFELDDSIDYSMKIEELIQKGRKK